MPLVENIQQLRDEVSLRAEGKSMGQIVGDAIRSRMTKFLLISLGLHVVFIAGTSFRQLMPAEAAGKPGDKPAAAETKSATRASDKGGNSTENTTAENKNLPPPPEIERKKVGYEMSPEEKKYHEMRGEKQPEAKKDEIPNAPGADLKDLE